MPLRSADEITSEYLKEGTAYLEWLFAQMAQHGNDPFTWPTAVYDKLLQWNVEIKAMQRLIGLTDEESRDCFRQKEA